jgi:hypothetical protein
VCLRRWGPEVIFLVEGVCPPCLVSWVTNHCEINVRIFCHRIFRSANVDKKTFVHGHVRYYIEQFPKRCFPEQCFPKQCFPEQCFPKQRFPEWRFPERHFPEQRFPKQHF